MPLDDAAQDLDYVLKLFEAKGWYLYEGGPGVPFDKIISDGKASKIHRNAFYHIVPASGRANDPDEVAIHLANARERGSDPKYDDKVNRGHIHAVYVSDAEVSFLSDPDAFAFPLAASADVADAIKFNVSNYNVHYFNSVDDIRSFVKDSSIGLQGPSPLPRQVRWTYATRDEDPTQVAIVPENPPRVLFRGQVKRYEPCFPSASRVVDGKATRLNELNDRDQARLIANLVKTQWFVNALRETAAVRWMNQQRLHIDEVAVAQHYGLPTGYIDLTQSLEVAAFFACCRYNSQARRWEPATEGKGVIYAVDWHSSPFRGPVRPINLQVFPRPSEQWGWSHEMRLGEDFDKLPYVTKLIFKHDERISARILNHFLQGKSLFPPDPLSTLADRIVDSKTVPEVAAVSVAQDLISDPQGLSACTVEDLLKMVTTETGIVFSAGAVAIGMDEVNSEMETLWNERRGSFLEGVGIRLARTLRSSE